MADTNLTHEQEMHVESHAPYLKVFAALAVFTAVEYWYAHISKDNFTSLVVGLMIMAIIKAGLVGWYFMHLKFEGRWVYYMLIPAGILAAVLMFGLMPDIGHKPDEDDPVEDDAATAAVSAPFVPAPSYPT